MYSAIAANKRNTIVIMILFVLLIAAIGGLLGYYYQSDGVFWGVLIGAMIYAGVQYFIADKLALSTNGAQEISKQDNPRLWLAVENLAITTGLPMPKVYIINDPSPNAFATGRDPHHASVTATSGLLDIMNDSELEAVLAHELGHVQNYDIRVMMIVFGLVSAIGLLADIMTRMLWFGGRDDDERDGGNNPLFLVLMIVAAILTPIIASLVQLAVSRQREYLADATSALTTRHPQGLESALAKIEQVARPMQRQSSSTAHLFFANPLKKNSLGSILSTHPPTADRIDRLRRMESQF